jgi:nucleotide-binding universal stress UspA family protein
MNFEHTSIVIAVDDAGSSGRALDYGLEMAEALQLPVRIIHVATLRDPHQTDYQQLDLGHISKAADGMPELELGAALLDRAMERAGERQIEMEPVLLVGDPTDCLLRFLDECDKPMLFVGRRGQSRLRELILGSVSDKLVRHAKCPVFVIS